MQSEGIDTSSRDYNNHNNNDNDSRSSADSSFQSRSSIHNVLAGESVRQLKSIITVIFSLARKKTSNLKGFELRISQINYQIYNLDHSNGLATCLT